MDPSRQRLALGLAAAAAAGLGSGALATGAPVKVTVDAGAGRHPISPLIYGVAYGTRAALADLNCPLNRYGGNNASRYNWMLNADNRGADWYFESIGDPSSTPGERGDSFTASSRAGGAEPMLTVPTIGWVGKVGPARAKLAAFSIRKYGAQTASDRQWFADAGNGILEASHQPVRGNDRTDANAAADSAFQSGWIRHLVSRWGLAARGGVKYYLLDNEPSLWHSTHRDVHPDGARMDEVLHDIVDYGTMIKRIDPHAIVVGPEEWGWSGYLFSGYDQQYGSTHGWSALPDRARHNGMDYLPWLLDQLRGKDRASGRRILDVFSVHYYPQGGEGGSDTSAAMQLRRNRSTRSLWDPNYTDESWIASKVELIPRLKRWVAAYYPGTRTAITEYNWGAENRIGGATAEADVLGIFGREGLDMAARWTAPAPASPTYRAMRLYRNYDGRRSTFGDMSVSTIAPDPDSLAAFGAVRTSDSALTVMVVNKALTGEASLVLALSRFRLSGIAHVWQLTAANRIDRLPDVIVSGNRIGVSLPAQSVTLFVVRSGGSGGGTRGARPRPARKRSAAARIGVRESASSPTIRIK